MKKLLRPLFVGFLLILGGCGGEKNQIPKQYLGKYKAVSAAAKITEKGNIIDDGTIEGFATLAKKGDRYILKIERNDNEVVETDDVIGKIVKERASANIELNAKLETIKGKAGEFQEFYVANFWDTKMTGDENKQATSLWQVLRIEKELIFTKENNRYVLTIAGFRFIKE